jgi:hypothetical protein
MRNATRRSHTLPICVSPHRPREGPRSTCLLTFHAGVSVNAPLERGKEAVRHERAISSLRDRTGAPLAEVRSLFTKEFSRLELGAKVRSYLAVLTTSNVLAMLRRTAARSADKALPKRQRDAP